MKFTPILAAISINAMIGFALMQGTALAQDSSNSSGSEDKSLAPEIEVCRASGLIALKERSSAVKDVTLDLDSVRLIKVNSKIASTDVKAIVLADVNVEKKKSDKSQNFICIVGEKGKVLLTVFSDQ
ncbi:hypothetical protein [Methylocapsa palsarum]|uniref:Uncharacterized protein n=1 Tax=Methylocapsa palsarum TaxID=1612308 RepID=A0A1I3WC65_9HYPH|nr:hypothetical protein [Methylocapsa palsarum]SFK05254.1 hypothetical protein SAMN05444581_101519 [Methylocapsa palsarum]